MQGACCICLFCFRSCIACRSETVLPCISLISVRNSMVGCASSYACCSAMLIALGDLEPADLSRKYNGATYYSVQHC